MFSGKGSTRRERTFVGSTCAACEEPLEHVLRGERIIQLTCGHVAHEACFYEYIKEFEVHDCPSCDQPLGIDTSRGGNIDFGNLSKLARSVQTPDLRERSVDPASTPSTRGAHDGRRSKIAGNVDASGRPSREHLLPDQFQQASHRQERYASPYGPHGRSASEAEPTSHGRKMSEASHPGGRRHDYDVQSMEASVRSTRHSARNPIPPPLVTVRSEFPTLNKSRQQQSLTCMVTVEVMEGKWNPQPDDIQSPISPRAHREDKHEPNASGPLAVHTRQVDSVHEDLALQDAKEDLLRRVENWHGLDFERFGRLLLHGVVHVGKDRQTWQELECYLFSDMLICVKEKKTPPNASMVWEGSDGAQATTRCILKGSILVKKHLEKVDVSPEQDVLTLSLSVVELPAFHLHFQDSRQLEVWKRALSKISGQSDMSSPVQLSDDQWSAADDEYMSRHNQSTRSRQSSYGGPSEVTATSEYSESQAGMQDLRPGSSLHIPLDIVVVVPATPSTKGLKMNLLRDSLRFLVSTLGERDRMSLVTFGSGSGSGIVVGMTTKRWSGWAKAIQSIRPRGQKNVRADAVDGANVAIDVLVQRKAQNPLSHILLISDSSTSDQDNVDYVVSRAKAATIGIHSFGLGLTHKPDAIVEMSMKTKASYTYVKDWMMLRESLAGCLGALQSISHQDVKLKLRLPKGSPAKLVKISGAIHITKMANGRDSEVSLGDLRFGDKRDILIQLAIQPDDTSPDNMATDPWESIISGLEALGPMEQEESRAVSVEELPLLQADLVWGDLLREGDTAQLSRPSLLAITMLPASKKGRNGTPPIPPHPSVVQRRMELLTSDMLSRALGLVARGQNERAQHLLAETRSILKGLGKGGLPPLPPPPPTPATVVAGSPNDMRRGSPFDGQFADPLSSRRSPSLASSDATSPMAPAAGINRTIMTALDSELESSLEWICQPTVFGRDTRKAVLQAISVISSQRGNTYRSPAECLWAQRIPGVRRLIERSVAWRDPDSSDDALDEDPESTRSVASFRSYSTNDTQLLSRR